ncbi:hypothetical protein [Desulfonatronum lacustre]|uniref:hypothetical protein n=1 Tax=Desulfonatronum lacustre TaxID=66849 RepID=UPI00048B50FF|nr:hypothetical protein [Desulfonatronum lacustre]
MNLQEFVKTALADIIAGVADARPEAHKHGANVGSNRVYGHVKDAKVITDEKDRPVTTVEFDIALAEASAKDTKGGIGVFLGTVGLGSQGSSHGESSSHSRIKFSVPVVFPSDEA